ncbi:MAG: YraN family protein [bacterium]
MKYTGRHSLQLGRYSQHFSEVSIGTKNLGDYGEDKASLFLKKRGFFVIQRNFHAGRGGEIDIICRKENTIVFVEVKLRRSEIKGSPRDAITPFKAKKMLFTAKCWLNLHREFSDMSYRFDFIGISYEKDNPVIDYIENILESSEF